NAVNVAFGSRSSRVAVRPSTRMTVFGSVAIVTCVGDVSVAGAWKRSGAVMIGPVDGAGQKLPGDRGTTVALATNCWFALSTETTFPVTCTQGPVSPVAAEAAAGAHASGTTASRLIKARLMPSFLGPPAPRPPAQDSA